MNYLAEQGLTQFTLLNKSKENEKILNDVRVPISYKEKIKKITEYKKYFYRYWKRKEDSIYSKTTLLNTDAVSYLVVVSPYDKIEAREECFPIVGCFPYLGFFKEKSAKKYQEKMEKQGYVTHRRAVYAYSTLGYFADPILSSFFFYDDFDLAEMIFHELFHTIFFIENEVKLNENLANYFAKEMAFDYFKMDINERKKKRENLEKEDKLDQLVVKLTHELNTLYKKNNKSSLQSKTILENFLEKKFFPEIKKKCNHLKINEGKCHYLKKSWNNASLAAFMTYEAKSDAIEKLRRIKKLSLFDFFHYIENRYLQYQKKLPKYSFSRYLFET